MSLLPSIIVNPKTSPDASVIWLHGLGASGHDFEPIVPELNLPADMAVRFIFPHAPEKPVTINAGYIMPSWYDIYSLDIDRKFNQEDLANSVAAIKDLIEHEIKQGIDSKRILIAGFSQGGAVAYEAALTFGDTLAGLMCMSTYFATKDNISIHAANKSIPIQVFHGIDDPVVPELLGQQAIESLKIFGFQPGYKTYPMQHEVCYPQIQDISKFIQACLK